KNIRALHRALSKLTPALERDVLPFLDAHQDLPSIDRLVNGSTQERLTYDYGLESSMSRVIVARLAGNPDWERLVRAHREWLEGRTGEEDLATYERIVRHLSHMPESGVRAEPIATPDRGGTTALRRSSPRHRRGG